MAEEKITATRPLTEFQNFAKKVTVKMPQSTTSYRNAFGRTFSSVSNSGFTKEEVREILESGNPDSIRELSKYFNRYSGVYSRTLQYYATLLNYGYLIVPHYDIDSRPKKMKNIYKKIAQYVKDMNLGYILPQINLVILTEGVYYGLLLETPEEKPYFYRLPAKFCRSRFLDTNGLPILEIDLNYFDNITTNEVERRQILSLFPKYVATRYNSKSTSHLSSWVLIPPTDGGLCFFFQEDQTPPFAAVTQAAKDLEDARDRENQRNDNELEKILVHKLPINKNDGELLFSLDEAAVLHESICNMLAERDNVDVLTTFGEVDLESVQDTEATASSSESRMGQYLNNVYDDFGTSSVIFNADSNATALTFSLKKDISLMYYWSKQYETAINCVLKRKSKNNSLYFSITLLPTSSIFRKEDVDMYLKTAQYGYPRAAVAATMGLDMVDLAQVADFENNVLHLEKSMIPLSSSYTQSGKEEKSSGVEKKSEGSTSSGDPTDEGGRPQKSIEDRADKTNTNRDGAT